MGLFAPKWMNKDKNKAMNVVENEFDSAKLARAAQESPHADVRSRALVKCNDQEAYKKAVLSDSNAEVRYTAVLFLKDQETLKYVAGTDSSAKVRTGAILGVADEMYRIAYARQINDRDLALAAAEGVKSEKGRAMLIVTCGKSYIVDKYLKQLGNVKKLSADTLAILRQSNDPKVKEFLFPLADSATRNKTFIDESNNDKRIKLISLVDDVDELYRVAVEDKYPALRVKAFDRLEELYRKYGRIKHDWWKEHMDQNVRDQRQAWLLRRSSEDEAAARELAKMLVNYQDDSDYVWSRMPMEVLEQIEKMLTDGSKKAEVFLYRLYKTKTDLLNPALQPYARQQGETRAYQKHKDAMVDSTVCGETFRHEDCMYGEFVNPLG